MGALLTPPRRVLKAWSSQGGRLSFAHSSHSTPWCEMILNAGLRKAHYNTSRDAHFAPLKFPPRFAIVEFFTAWLSAASRKGPHAFRAFAADDRGPHGQLTPLVVNDLRSSQQRATDHRLFRDELQRIVGESFDEAIYPGVKSLTQGAVSQQLFAAATLKE